MDLAIAVFCFCFFCVPLAFHLIFYCGNKVRVKALAGCSASSHWGKSGWSESACATERGSAPAKRLACSRVDKGADRLADVQPHE